VLDNLTMLLRHRIVKGVLCGMLAMNSCAKPADLACRQMCTYQVECYETDSWEACVADCNAVTSVANANCLAALAAAGSCFLGTTCHDVHRVCYTQVTWALSYCGALR
jgi:hypothetical protein